MIYWHRIVAAVIAIGASTWLAWVVAGEKASAITLTVLGWIFVIAQADREEKKTE